MSESFYPSNFTTHSEELGFLKTLGFAVSPYNKIANDIDSVWNISQRMYNGREAMPYKIDGMVVKLDNNNLSSALGVVGKTPRGWCAIKFPAQEITTKIIAITWQVGRTGRIIPVAELDPVELDGTVVKRATLHNYKEVIQKDMSESDVVVIRKAGDIIPEVVEVLYNLRGKNRSKFQIITKCPSCSSKLVKTDTGVDLYCANPSCPAQVVEKLSYYCQRNIANIIGLSDKSLEKFISIFGLDDISDLYNLPYSEIFELDGYGRKSVDNLAKSIEKSRIIEDYKFLAGTGIDGVGPEVSKLICGLIDKNEKK